MEPKRSGLGYASLAVGGIGILCCICSLILAIVPGALHQKAVHSVREDRSPHGSIGQLLASSGLEALRLRLVDPDAQSDELEDPAILLDPASLQWASGVQQATAAGAQQGDQPDDDHYSEESTRETGLGESSSSLLSNTSRPARVPRQSRPNKYHNPNMTCVLDQKLLNYTINRIQSTPLVLEPYPHLYVTKVFEPNFYQNCLLPRLPPNEAYSPLPNNPDRTQIPFSGKYGYGPQAMNRVGRPIGELEPEKAAVMDVDFWTNFGKLFASEQMIKVWLFKFYPTTKNRDVMKRLKKIDKTYWYMMSLGRDLRGYSIGPHTDTADKWVTTLYYLARNNRHPDLGTCVVKSKSGMVSKGNFRGKLDGTDFVIEKQAPYVRNSLMSFSACEASWHAVQKVPGDILRDTIQGFVSGQMFGGKKECGKMGDPLAPDESEFAEEKTKERKRKFKEQIGENPIE
mmetsp:Transcript_40061/g.55664  ORF Transcript_40061/g.55664 Transcript_40061/m.55664 type:complete len:457 (+) Transcript_40061:219-1589(+)|eukprot:CAMPEP_0196582792 /NCGR_PEP_ID=MMETSP1081-20130531/40679_1 /TAXON_ID=36882 /ORGANISM="Pyramimonas amylifera, Strain CCMP720" /LENGTH=456 /DNA_ID=CAMNT_0041903475 /DNA_START=204 /DNA_END=1574 /DNA_ORIENTATION=+